MSSPFRVMTSAAVLLVALMASTTHSRPAMCAEVNDFAAFQEAEQFVSQGRLPDAFLKYLQVRNGESSAARIARPEAKKYLGLLSKHSDSIPTARRLLLEAELHLALNDRAKALALFRHAAAMIASKPDEGWQQGRLPADEYFVDQNAAQHDPYGRSYGGGSHRDNWLIRRFIALEAWDDAAREFERMWQQHRLQAEPYVVKQPVKFGVNNAVEESQWFVVQPHGFRSSSLQFILDYAYFLNRQNQRPAAQAMIIEALLRMDMDRNPNYSAANVIATDAQVAQLRHVSAHRVWHHQHGHSRRSFIRLAYGAMKSWGQETQLVQPLVDDIAKGNNRLRRVLAQVRWQQQQPDAALKLELEYIANGKFDPLSTAYRRMVVFDDAHQAVSAIEAAEQALKLAASVDSKLWNFADAFELDDAYQQQQQQIAYIPHYGFEARNPDVLQFDLMSRLERLYSATGQTDVALAIARRKFLLPSTNSANQFSALTGLMQQHRVVSKEAVLRQWAQAELATAKTASTKACLHWALDDWKAAADAIVRVDEKYAFERWKEAFKAAGNERWLYLLRARVAAMPKDIAARIELAEIEVPQDDAQWIAHFETILEMKDAPYGGRFKGRSHGLVPYRDAYEVAYRLMRLYERNAAFDKLQALGLRIAQRQAPFTTTEREYRSTLDKNDWTESANAALALAIHHAATPAQLTALQAAFTKHQWPAAEAQIARKLQASEPETPATAFGWANMPNGVRLIASNENVLCLHHDQKHVYVGHPWGVAIYNFNGEPVTRVALEDAAKSITTLNQFVWVGSPKGLFRIDQRDWSVAHQWMHHDVPEDQRYSRSFQHPVSYWFDNSIYHIASDGRELWIGLHRNVQRYNPTANTIRAYSLEEMQLQNWGGFHRIEFDGRYVWAEGQSGLRRYDRETDEWREVASPTREQEVHLVGIIGDRVIGDCYVGDKLRHRLCVINRETLKLEVIRLMDVKVEAQLINEQLRHFGKFKGDWVFGTSAPQYVWNQRTNTMHPLREANEPMYGPEPHQDAAHQVARLKLAKERFDVVDSAITAPWLTQTLPNGMRVLAARQNGVRYEHPQEDTGGSGAVMQHELRDEIGGLYFIKPDGAITRVSNQLRNDSIWADEVHDLHFDKAGAWAATSLGIVKLDNEVRVQTFLTRRHGLISNRVTSIASSKDRTYFGTGWGDSAGGLAVYDSSSKVLTSITSEDGLPTNKISGVNVEGDQLRVTFGTEYLRYDAVVDQRYRQHQALTLNPLTRLVGPIAVARLSSNEPQIPRAAFVVAPFLGGKLLKIVERDGQQYRLGTRGIVVMPSKQTAKLVVTELNAKQLQSESTQQLLEARQRPVMIDNFAQIAAAMNDPNLFYRANMLANASNLNLSDMQPLLLKQMQSRNQRLRCTALHHLVKINDPEVIRVLKGLTQDSNHFVRSLASLTLIRRGIVPETLDVEDFERVGNYPFGAESSLGVICSRDEFIKAAAPHANAKIMEFLLKTPPHLQQHDRESITLFENLGRAVQARPQLVDTLLAARDENQWQSQRRDFARQVLRAAGKSMLPRLHQALQSDDRIVRSNAARACGTIRDASSIQPLIKALDFESGLSRASIVWALGELKAAAALPVLATLYADAKSQGSNELRYQQQAAQIQSQYQQLASLDALKSEWNELKQQVFAFPINPRREEELLEPRHILEAVQTIGPELSQDFYRALVSATDVEIRVNAAINLASGTAADRAKNLPLLSNLLKDKQTEVRTAAAASLLLLQDRSGERVLLEALRSEEVSQKHMAMNHLQRLTKTKDRAFAKADLQMIASDQRLVEVLRQIATNLLRGL